MTEKGPQISCTETVEIMQNVWLDKCMSKTLINGWWYKRFKNGVISHSGRRSTTLTADKIQHVQLVIEKDHRLIVCKIENDFRISKTSVWEILMKNLVITRVCAKLNPKFAYDNLLRYYVITGNELWVGIGYDPETTQQSS